MIEFEIKGLNRSSTDSNFISSIELILFIGDNAYENLDCIVASDEILAHDIQKDLMRRRCAEWPFEHELEVFADPAPTLRDLSHLRCEEIPNSMRITVPNDVELASPFDEVSISKDKMLIRCYYSHLGWHHEWSIRSYFEEIKKEIENNQYENIEGHVEEFHDEDSVIYIIFRNHSIATIEENYNRHFHHVVSIQEKVLDKLREKFKYYKLVAQFSFPDHVKHECEQYLSYFGQFLYDIGIDVDTEIKRKGRDILFSIAPADKYEAIERISQALALFLMLPIAPSNIISPSSNDNSILIKYQRMEAAISHLNSQLKLAEATILAQRDHIHSLKEINANVLAASLIKVVEDNKESDGINLFQDVIKIKKFKGKGFEIDIPRVISKAKKLTKKLMK